MINKAKEGGEVRGGVASEATMNFEGRKAHAVGEGQIKKLLAAYTSYVSMDSTDKASSREMDAKLKRNMTSFNLTDDIQDVFDEKAIAEVDKRCGLIREEYLRGETPIIEKSLEANFTRKELKAAMKKLKTKYWKSTTDAQRSRIYQHPLCRRSHTGNYFRSIFSSSCSVPIWIFILGTKKQQKQNNQSISNNLSQTNIHLSKINFHGEFALDILLT